jgi:hypothetical protein
MMDQNFIWTAREAYISANAGTLSWMLDRPRLHGKFLNTKQNSLTMRDYKATDGWRAPEVLYGWIQGRGLEALIMHARFFDRTSPALAERLREAAEVLYQALADLYLHYGHAYFSYDRDLRPVYPGPSGEILAQHVGGSLATYSDIFVVKGLIAASIQFEPARTRHYLDRLGDIIRAVEEGRFITDERQALHQTALVHQGDEYGPRMILIGAAAMLVELGLSEEATFAERFIEHVLRRHVDDGSGGGLLGSTRDIPGGDRCNPGHAIEFVGFALETLQPDADPALIERLEQVLLTSFMLGFDPPGIRLSISLSGAQQPSDYRPWWSLPEAIRAAARGYERTRNVRCLEVWKTAHNAFFRHYWRTDPPIAFQTLTSGGPVDFVPATPDLDPGYHTGLSFLSAIRAIDNLGGGR